MPGSAGEPVIDALEEVWGSLAGACADLGPGEWDRPTDCPGWSVKDQLSHLIGIERMLQGAATPPMEGPMPAHVRNEFAAGMEPWVAARRALPGAAVLAEFVAVTAERLAELRAAPPERFDEVGWSPVGQVPYRTFMAVRVFDSWIHEQDVRRALGRRGGRGGAGEHEALDRVAAAMPRAVGRGVAPPEGTTVAFVVDGPVSLAFSVEVVEGRGVCRDGAAAGATARLVFDAPWFWRLGCGRATPADALAAGGIAVEGDRALGQAVLGAMNFMF